MAKLNIKPLAISAVVLIAVLTAIVIFAQPKMHKVFQMNIIEYLMKINADGSVSTTKSVTTTVVKEK